MQSRFHFSSNRSINRDNRFLLSLEQTRISTKLCEWTIKLTKAFQVPCSPTIRNICSDGLVLTDRIAALFVAEQLTYKTSMFSFDLGQRQYSDEWRWDRRSFRWWKAHRRRKRIRLRLLETVHASIDLVRQLKFNVRLILTDFHSFSTINYSKQLPLAQGISFS